MDEKRTQTLIATEALMKPLVLATFVLCTAGLLQFLATPVGHEPAQVVLAVLACALLASNTYHLVIDGTTFGMVPVSLASLGLAGAAAGSTWAAALAAVVICWMATGFALLRGAYRHDASVPQDATLVVLGCAVEQGGPSRTLELRLRKAHEALLANPGLHAIVTGGPAAGGVTEAEVMRAWLVERGIDATRVHREPTARNTEENLLRSLELAQGLGLPARLCVVSSDYHLWRALHTAGSLGISACALPAKTPPASRLQQWCREVLVVCKDALLGLVSRAPSRAGRG